MKTFLSGAWLLSVLSVPTPTVAQHAMGAAATTGVDSVQTAGGMPALPVGPWTFTAPVQSADVPPNGGVSRSPDDGENFDLMIARVIRQSSLQGSGTVQAVAGVFRLASLPGTVLTAAGLFAAGELADREDLRNLGLHAGEAILAAGAVTLGTKLAVGRARPHTSPGDPYDIRFGRGLQGDDYQAFPSAHTAAAFATATVLASELTDHNPGTGTWLYPSLYASATLAGMSRLLHEAHWATDVIAGALVGFLSGALVLELQPAD